MLSSFFEQYIARSLFAQGEIMKWIILVLLMALCILTVICYALCVIAHEADERAERMYKAWKESKGADDECD